jgi:hypothetical protein
MAGPFGLAFEAPEWLWGLLAVPVVVLLDLLLRRVEARPVAHLPLWEEVLARRRPGRAPWRRILGILLAAATAAVPPILLARPTRPRPVPGSRPVVVVVDRSLGTRMRDGSGEPLHARLEALAPLLAKQAAGGGEASLLALDDGLHLVAGPGPVLGWPLALGSLPAPRGDRALLRVVEARPLWPPETLVLVLTPFAPAEADEAALAAVGIQASGLGPLPAQAGIVGVEEEPGRLRVDVEGTTRARTLLALREDGTVLARSPVRDAEGHQEILLALPLEDSPPHELRLLPPDPFPEDDQVPLAGAGRAGLRILLVAEGPTPYLDAALEAMAGRKVDARRSGRAGRAEFPPLVPSYDVIILCGVDLEVPLPPGRYLLLGSRVPDLPLAFAAGPPGPLEVGVPPRPDALVRGLDLQGWRVEEGLAIEARPGAEVVVPGSRGPLLARVRGRERSAVVLAVRPDLRASTLPLLAAFPLFLEAALDELGGAAGRRRVVHRAGGVLEDVAAPHFVDAQGRVLAALPDPLGGGVLLPEEPGRYRIQDDGDPKEVAVAWLDHPGRPGPALSPRDPPPPPARVEVAPLDRELLLLLAGLLLLGWWLFAADRID